MPAPCGRGAFLRQWPGHRGQARALQPLDLAGGNAVLAASSRFRLDRARLTQRPYLSLAGAKLVRRLAGGEVQTGSHVLNDTNNRMEIQPFARFTAWFLNGLHTFR